MITHDDYIKRREDIVEGLKLASDWEYNSDNFGDMPNKALTTPQARQAIDALVLDARNQAIEDVKFAGYGYDDGAGFVLKISYLDLEKLKNKENHEHSRR